MKNIRRTLVLLLSAVAIFSLAPTNLMADKPVSPPGKPEIVPPESPPGKPEIAPPGKKICVRHNGIKYCEVTSATERVWLDRNLGAARVCRALDDDACYGDYYQWGRNADGHEDSLSGTYETQATNVNDVGHRDFIIKHDDWASTDTDGSNRSANWSATNGSSVCPVGYRVPTMDELNAERESWATENRAGAFGSPLKFPSSGDREYINGQMEYEGISGYIWSSYVISSNTGFLYFHSEGSITHLTSQRAFGWAVRCIKN